MKQILKSSLNFNDVSETKYSHKISRTTFPLKLKACVLTSPCRVSIEPHDKFGEYEICEANFEIMFSSQRRFRNKLMYTNLSNYYPFKVKSMRADLSWPCVLAEGC